MKLFSNKLVPFLSGLLTILFAISCSFQSTSQAVAKAPDDPNVVAKINEYTITRAELDKRLFTEIYPDRYNYYNEDTKLADANSVLLKMIADKAMILEARQKNFLEDETVNQPIKSFRDKRMINLLLQNYLQEMKDKITATEAEIEKRMQADPNAVRTRTKAIIENNKATNIISQYYNRLYTKFHVKKLSDQFPQAMKIHDRLLNHPKKPQRMKYIRNNQIREEITPEEKNIVLATFDHGKVTLEDWFVTLCEPAPPSRPKNLNTLKGIEQLLDRALIKPIYIAEAKLQNLDKNENLLKQVREYEDGILLSNAKRKKYKEVNEPTTEQIVAFYNNNKETFRTGRLMKIEQIWCPDMKTARTVKAKLDNGDDFESLKQEYSLEKKSKAFNTSPGNEGLFWKELWQADPNDIVGPLKGFYSSGIKWRDVKILEKKSGEIKEYSTNMNNNIKSRIMSEQRNALLADYRRELLKKYPHEIYSERIKDIDPLDIP